MSKATTMKNSCLKHSLLVLFLFGLHPRLHAEGTDWQTVYEKASPSIPFINSSGGLCSGALVSEKLILTAKHCVENLRDVWVAWPEAPKKREKATILYLDANLDFALVELLTPADPKRIPLELSESLNIKEGSPAATIGHPTTGSLFGNPPFDLERTHLFSSGHISKFTGNEIIIDFSISPGNSGGPVLNKEGQVIGVVSRKLIQQFVGNIGYAVSHLPVRLALAALKIKGELPEPTLSDIPPQFSFGLLTAWDGFQTEIHSRKSSFRTSFQAELLMADRVSIFYSNNFGLNKIKFSSYGLGYKFHREFSNTVPYQISPFVEAMEYSPKELNGSPEYHSLGTGVIAGVSGMGMNIKLSRVFAYKKSYWAFALVFGN